MSTIVTRAGKGSALTWAEGDANFINLNTDLIAAQAAITQLQIYKQEVGQPGFFASKSVAQEAGFVYIYDVVDFNTDTVYNSTTGIFTASTGGIYSMSAWAGIENTTGGTLDYSLFLVKNGIETICRDDAFAVPNAVYANMVVNVAAYKLNQGDTIRIEGTNLAINKVLRNGHFSVRQIGVF